MCYFGQTYIMYKWPFFILLIFFTQTGAGQTDSVKNPGVYVKVRNEKQEPVESATVKLIRYNDSSLVKTAISDEKGMANNTWRIYI
jgi:hypothetical protein